MKYALYLGKILGVRIYIHWTFVLLIGWVVFSSMRAGLDAHAIFWSVVLVLAVFACVVLHELGHAMAARRYKIITKHITLLPIGGVAQLETMPEKPRQELVVALAGPAVNVAIALILLPFANARNLLETESLATLGPENFLFFLVSINIWLALFNLIPAFPMDGGRVLRALLSFSMGQVKATKVASVVGQLLGILFFFVGFLYNPMLIFIGIFVFLSGQYESSAVETAAFLHRYTVNDVLMREIPSVESHSSIKEAAQILLNTQNKNFVVTDQGKPVGTLSREAIISAMEEKGEQTLVENVKNNDLVFVSPETPLDEVWKLMQSKRKPLILVQGNGELAGIVEEENMAEFILLRSAVARKSSTL